MGVERKMICHLCGHEILDQARYCPDCGTVIPRGGGQFTKESFGKTQFMGELGQLSQKNFHDIEPTHRVIDNKKPLLSLPGRKQLLRFFILFIAFLNPMILMISQFLIWETYSGFSYLSFFMIIVYGGLQIYFLRTFKSTFSGNNPQNNDLFKFFVVLIAFVNPSLLVIFHIVIWILFETYSGFGVFVWILFIGMQIIALYHYKHTFDPS